MSRWDGDANVWGEAENMGPSINTVEDEDGVFIHPDGTTLYFSSKGHTCMGGYDVFKSSFSDGKWSAAANLGWPVNSPDDDLFFVLTANGTTGYFSSVRPNGLGEDDLYRVDFLPEANAEETASMFGGGSMALKEGMKTVLLKGKIMDYKALAALEATIELMDLSDARLVATFTSDPSTGEYLVAVPGGRQYAMIVRAGGYLLHSENIAMPQEASALEMNLVIKMQPIEVDHKEVMRNIFFERDKAGLDPASLAEMGHLLNMLRENPSLRLEIGGYTDSDGKDDHNDQLSTERAYAVVSHLVNNGIPSDRLVAVGYGSANPLLPNDSDENKAKNRRTEIRVL